MTPQTNIDLRRRVELTVTNEIVYTLDLSGYFSFLNAEGERLSGYSCEEVRRLRVTDIVAPEFAECVQKQILQTIARRVGAVYQIEIITRDRRRLALETSIHLVTGKGKPKEIHGIALPPVGTLWNPRARCLDANFGFGMQWRMDEKFVVR